MPFCIMCGAELAPDDKFCYSCGAPVEPDSSPQAESQQEQRQQPSQQQPSPQQPSQQMPPQMPQQPQNVVVEATPVEEPMHVCSKCGAQLQPGTKFCKQCGGQATVRMVKNLFHQSFRAPSTPGEFSVPIGQVATGGMSAMQPAMSVLSAGLQAARSATRQVAQSAKPAKKKKSVFGKFMKGIGKRIVWAAISAGISYGGYYVYQHKDEVWAWITGLFS